MFSNSELEGLGRDELAQLAEDHGHTVKARATKADLVSMLTGDESAPEQIEPRSDAEKAAAGRNKDRVKIVIHSDANDSSQVKVGVNGRMYLIKRDVEVEVPREVVSVLEDAVETHLEPTGQREDGCIEYLERSHRRFAFDIRG